MSSSTLSRATLRRIMPARVKRAYLRMRSAMQPPPIDDAVLANYRFAKDDNPDLRLNLVIPNLRRREAYGGVATGFDIVLRLATCLAKEGPCDLRLIITDPDQETDPSIAYDAADPFGIPAEAIELLQITKPDHAVATRARDIFVTFNWWATLNIDPLRAEQARAFGRHALPLTYLIQEYEPQLMPFSSAHLLAREAYDHPDRLWGVFNSSQLHRYFAHQGHEVERSFVFEPVINAALRPFLADVPSAQRSKRILVYGRPTTPRNCWPALVRGLQWWAQTCPSVAEWEVVSAGMAHAPVPLGNGIDIRPLGKLSLVEYARTLLGARVGVSLMASPHPSYPPLEMAHMGLRTVTNTYLGKDLADHHANIRSIDSIAAPQLGQAITDACKDSATPPSGNGNPGFLRDDHYPFIPELAAALLAVAG